MTTTEPKRAGRPRAHTDARIRDLATQVATFGYQMDQIVAAQREQQRALTELLGLLRTREQHSAAALDLMQAAINAATENAIETIRTDTRQLVLLFPQLVAQQAAFMQLLRAVYGAPEERTV